jgi:hypothetical protein
VVLGEQRIAVLVLMLLMLLTLLGLFLLQVICCGRIGGSTERAWAGMRARPWCLGYLASACTTSSQVLDEQRLLVLLLGPTLDPVLVPMQCAACAAGELL